MNARNVRRAVMKFAPLALTMIAAAGTVATGYFAAKAGYKSVERLKEAEEDKGEPLTTSEKVKEVGLMYVPAIASGIVTIGSTVGSYAVGRKINLGLGAAYLAAKNEYKRYSDEVREEYGDEAHAKILSKMAMPGIERANPENDVLVHSSFDQECNLDFEALEEERTFLDAWSGKYFVSTINRVMAAEQCLNRQFVLIDNLCGKSSDVSLAAWYEYLGIEPPKDSDNYCWLTGNDLYWIDFNHYKMTTDDGFECCVIEFASSPYPNPYT